MSNPLFKAKTHKGEWVYGYYYEQNDKAYILQDGKAYEVRKETRCQYLGLKNGIDIYEHDIVRVKETMEFDIRLLRLNSNETEKQIDNSDLERKTIRECEGEVLFEDSCFVVGDFFVGSFSQAIGRRFISPVSEIEIEVIGNKFDK